MKLLKACAGLAALAAVLVGVPWLLVLWTDPPSLLGVDWGQVLVRPDDGRILLEILGLLGWFAWIALAVTALAEVVRAASRGTISLRLPGMGWLQPFVRVAVATALAPFMGLGVGSQADYLPPAPAAAAPLAPEPAPPDQGSGTEEVEQRPGHTAHAVRHYEVQPGDELWGIAEQELGSGLRWREIITLNPGLTADRPVLPGTHLALPASPQEAAEEQAGTPDQADAADPVAANVQVRPGDTLWGLADDHLSDAHRWPEIHRANQHLITNPDHIEIGWVLSLPHTTTAPGEATDQNPPTGPGGVLPTDDPALIDAHPGRDPGSAVQQTPTESTTQVSEEDQPAASTRSAPEPVPAGEAPATEPAEHGHSDDTPDVPDGNDSPLSVLAPVGGVLAAGIFAGVAARRRLQLLHRAVGHRLVPLTPRLEQFLTALGRKGQSAQHQGSPAPTTVTLGWEGDAGIQLELEPQRLTLVSGAAELTSAMTAGLLTSLMCSPWSDSVTVTAVQPDQAWDTALDDPRLDAQPHLDQALAALQQLVAGRRIAMRHQSLAQVRAHPDTAEAFAPHVTIFCAPLTPAQVQHINDTLSLGDVGVCVVAATHPGQRTSVPATTVDLLDDESAQLGTATFAPQLLPRPARRAIADLFTTAMDASTQPAPWWVDPPLPPNVSVLPRRGITPSQEDAMPPWSGNPQHPTLLLLGDVDLVGTSGSRPARAVGQCIEYCAWLLENPGSTPTSMAAELMVAETTRRSNMSRLRTWLGADADGAPYLPDAYTGRITLHDDVTSDWERFCLLLAGGVNLASSPTLRQALELVRGEPLHMVSFQWPWAEQLRCEMVAMITDAAAVLAERALEHENYDAAIWALGQGRKAAGHDETLASLEIQAFSLNGDRAAMDAAIRRLTRQARSEGRDLSPETARRIHHAIHTVTQVSAATL